MDVWGIAEGRIRRLERTQHLREGTAQNWDQYHYLMSASCPPDTFIHVRGGQWCDTGWGDCGEVPTVSFDMTEYATCNRNVRFTNANWYTYYWLSIHPAGTRLYIGGYNVLYEFATAAEAEEEAMSPTCLQLLAYPPWDYGIPIGCLILRNNGNTTDYNQFLSIDPVNRGRSYILRTHKHIAPRNVM